MDKRNNLWDIVRGIACLSVAFFHYTTKYNRSIFNYALC